MKLHPKDPPNSVIKGRHIDRLKQSADLVRKWYRGYNFLSIGSPSVFDKEVVRLVDDTREHIYTCGDLDTLEWKADRKADNVLCFEVLEHLCNPLLFLRRLKDFLSQDAVVFISIPNHLLRRHWRTLHYHEIDPVRFEHLCEQAGYRIVEHKTYRYWPRLRDVNGIRPLLRYISGYSWFISRTDRQFYVIQP